MILEDTPDLVFDPEPHAYVYKGAVVPSVTQLLGTVGIPDLSKIPVENLQMGADRGRKVHMLTEYSDRGILEEDGLSESGHAYLKLWREARRVLGIKEWSGIEVRLYATGYAGTPDRVWIDGKRGLLADIKTGTDLMAVGPQTAGYEDLIQKNLEMKGIKRVRFERVSVKLDIEKESPIIEPLKSMSDFAVFVSAFNIYNFKKHYRVFKGGL